MYDFGKFQDKEEKIENGITIYVPYDKDGKEFYAVMRQHCHPFYIAIDSNNIIVQAGPVPGAVRIAGYRIIGIDTVPDFTYGKPGDEIYGLEWDDKRNTIVKARKPFISLTAVRFRCWLLEKGLLKKTNEWINTLPAPERERAWIWFEYSGEFSRDCDYMPALVKGLSLDPVQFDEDWRWLSYD